MYGPEDPNRHLPNLVPIGEVQIEHGMRISHPVTIIIVVSSSVPLHQSTTTGGDATLIYDVEEGYRYYLEYIRVSIIKDFHFYFYFISSCLRLRRQFVNADSAKMLESFLEKVCYD